MLPYILVMLIFRNNYTFAFSIIIDKENYMIHTSCYRNMNT